MEQDELVYGLAWYLRVVEDGETIAPLAAHDIRRLLSESGLQDKLPRRLNQASPANVESLAQQLSSACDRGLIPRPPHIPIDHPEVGIKYTIWEARQ